MTIWGRFALRTLTLMLAASFALMYVATHHAERFEPSPSPMDKISANHTCWTGSVPLDMVGKIPGHAIVAFDDSGPHYVKNSKRAFDWALSPSTRDHNSAYIVYGFCK